MTGATPRVGVIGAGIFGATCALELSSRYPVTLFERADDILGGASWGNQNRHHLGYHYPRSPETVRQCAKSQASFAAVYGEALAEAESYYAVAATGSRTTAEEYLRFCDRHALPYRVAYPGDDPLSRDMVDLCVRVPEPVFDYWDLKRIVEKRLAAAPSVELHLGTDVVGGYLTPDGRKRLEVRHAGGGRGMHEFDVIVNASFYEINTVCGWFGLRGRDFQYDTKELAVVRLPTTRRLAITVMDGPFCTFLPMGRTDRFILGHVRESVLASDVSSASPGRLEEQAFTSRWPRIRDASAEYFPFVSRAELVESMVTRVVIDPESAEDDARVSEITGHGSGCWTVFSAKIVSCVTVAEELATQVDAYVGRPR